MRSLFFGIIVTVMGMGLVHGQEAPERDYFTPLKENEKEDIRFLINTLGRSSYFQLLKQRKALNEAGNRTSHIHPLRFLAYVFNDPNLRGSVKKINGVAWKQFRDGMAGSLETASARDNMDQKVLEDFSHQARVDRQFVADLVQRKQWRALIDGVRTRS